MDFGALLADSWKRFIDNIANLMVFYLLGFFLCFTLVLIPTVTGGFTRGLLAYVREGKTPEFSELWNFDGYLQILLYLIISCWLIVIGFMFCIIPGVILSVLWLYGLYFIVDRDMNFINAMAASQRTVSNTGFINNLVIFLIIDALNSVGWSVAGIGALITVPFGAILLTLAYIESCRPDYPLPDEKEAVLPPPLP